jgi:hypothetical protein
MITRVLQIMALMTALALPALCQSSQLSPQDQHEFDKAYAKWVNDTRKNDRDDIAKDVRKMQDIMARYNIPPDEPFDRIASMGNSQGQYNNNYNNNNYNNGEAYSQNGQSRLSPEDQRDFDRYYSQWMDDSRRNDRDDAERDQQHMRDIMARNNIPPNVPFDQIATANGYQNGYNENYARGGTSGYGQARLSPNDQREFDKVYAKWMHDQRHDRDDVKKDERKMQDIMARYNIPPDVPFDQIASPNAGYRH